MRHLEVIEADEQRQRQMVQTGVDGMRERGYAMAGIEALPLLDALHELEQWQNFHSRKEHVRLNAIQLIQPFDGPLAAEYEMRCAQLVDVHDQEAGLNSQMNSTRLQEPWRSEGGVFRANSPLAGARHCVST